MQLFEVVCCGNIIIVTSTPFSSTQTSFSLNRITRCILPYFFISKLVSCITEVLCCTCSLTPPHVVGLKHLVNHNRVLQWTNLSPSRCVCVSWMSVASPFFLLLNQEMEVNDTRSKCRSVALVTTGCGNLTLGSWTAPVVPWPQLYFDLFLFFV